MREAELRGKGQLVSVRSLIEKETNSVFRDSSGGNVHGPSVPLKRGGKGRGEKRSASKTGNGGSEEDEQN